MEVGIILMWYVKVLMVYVEERGVEERFYYEFVILVYSFCIVKGFCVVFDNFIVFVNEKFNLICMVVDGDYKLSEEFICFIWLVFKERREIYL